MNREESRPASRVDELATRVLLGAPDEGDAEQLGRALAESAESRQLFLDHAIVQSVLIEEAKAGSFAENRAALFELIDGEPKTRLPRNPLRWVSAAAAVLMAGLLVFLALKLPGRADAMESLEQLIEAFGRLEDRSYVVRVIDDGERRRRGPRPREQEPRAGRYPPAAYLDGSHIHLRGNRQFVLEQELPNGERRVMGGDGEMSWSIRGNGPVRISEDPRRFRGGVPGGRRHEFAFLDLRSQLGELKELYRLEMLEPPAGNNDLHGLRGRRHSRHQGGPKEVEIWFAADTGTIHRMVLAGLPTDRGGPRRLELILESSGSLGPDFFNHEAHHEPGRPIEPEPDRRP